MTALLTDNLPLLAGAPNGIKKLRELILELAVRGKLMPQDPSDEPASELLKRIAEEKARLVAEGKIKKQMPLAEIDKEAEPFELPAGWKWSSLAQVAFINPRNAAADSLEVSFVPMTFIGTRFDDQHAQEPRLWGEVKQGFTHFAESDIGVAKITPCFENSKACVFSNLVNGLGAGTTELHIVRPVAGTLDPRYVLAYLKSPQFLLVGETKMTGTAGQKRLPKDFVEANPFPLPPLAEQHRIVAKVDELMALCDRLEAQQAEAKSAHAQLVQALLDSLTQARDATDFHASWRLLAAHFHALFTTESSIDALKQNLLQLAVMGKLVQQDPSDEPASELLKRIADNRSEHRKKKLKSIADSSEVEKPFELPANWTWVTFPAVGELARGKSRHRPRNDPALYTGGNIPLIQTGDVARADGIVKTYSAMYNAKGVEQSRLWPAGTMCITIAANIADSALLGFDACFPDSVVGFIPDLSELNVRYFEFFLRTAKSRLEDFAPSTAQKNINLEILGLLSVPLPPANEAHRIVAKVDQLMTLCDKLKTRLTQARQLKEQLSSTLVERALAGDGQKAPIVSDQKTARTLLAAEVTHRLHAQRTFGQRKLQKVVYLAEHAARLATIQATYLRNVAGPHDRQLMNQVETEMKSHQWYERIERETVGHAYRPLSQAGQHRQAYNRTWSAKEQANIEQVIELMRDWDTDRCEMTVTLYAAWNDFIIEGRQVTDDDIVDEVMHRWNEAKLRFSKGEWLAVLTEMKKHGLLTPTGFGKRTSGGTLNLPRFE